MSWRSNLCYIHPGWGGVSPRWGCEDIRQTMRRAVAILLVAAGSAGGAVRINEFVARTSIRLLQRDTNGVFQVGTGTPWMMPSFCDTNWVRGVGPFGYGTSYTTDLDSTMRGLAMSLYLRYAFTVDGTVAASADPVHLTISFDPGFVAYLNGREVVRKNLGAPRSFVGYDHPAVCTNWTAGTNATYVLGVASNLLAAGTNVLAIHLCNDLVSSPTFGVSAQLSVSGAAPVALVQPFDSARYFPGFHEPSGGLVAAPYGTPGPGREWTSLSFDDADWSSGPGGLGFGDGDDATDLYAQMFDRATSLYLRQAFVVSPSVAASTNALRFIVDYDDGYVAYLNGREIKRAYLGAAGSYVPYDSIATSSHEAGTKVTNTLAAACSLLTPGTNVLAIQVCNRAADSTDLSMIADLQVTGAPPQWLARHENAWRYYVAETEPPVPAPANDDPLPAADFADWVEIHNDGDAAVSLGGWSLTDDPEAPRRWWFPTHAVLPAGGYALVLCTGTNVVDPDAPFWQADFKLEGSGEYLGLFDDAGVAVSEFSPAYPDQDFFHSYGWDAAAGGWRYFEVPTPAAANGGPTWTNIVAKPELVTPAGFYSGILVCQLSCETPGAALRFTLDGTEPTLTNGYAYNPTGFSRTVSSCVRARAFLAGCIPSETATRTFIINAPTAMRSLPVVSLTGDPRDSIFKSNGVTSVIGGYWRTSDPDKGVWFPQTFDDYSLAKLRGWPFERPATVEFLYPVSNAHYKADCGLRVAGSNYQRPRYKLQALSSTWYSTSSAEKPQFNLYFRSQYGPEPFEIPLTDGLGADRYESLRLRGGHNDISNPFILDEFARRLMYDTGQVSSRGILANLFVNGIYRCYYNPCERYTPDFFREMYGGTNDWDIMNHGGLDEGDTVAWDEMLKLAKTVNGGFTTLANYQSILTRLDATEYIDYLLVNMYGATWDWPNNNWYAARERSAAGRWRFHVWDAEGFMSNSGGKTNGYDTIGRDLLNGSYTNKHGICILYSRLRFSPEFRLLFADRAHRHCFNGGALTATNALAELCALKARLDPTMQYVRGTSVNVANQTNWIAQRPAYMMAHLRQYGLWPNTGPPLFAHPGGSVTNGFAFELSNTNASGQVYYAFDGADPRAPGGGVAGSLYAAPVVLDRSRHVKARVWTGAEWSPVTEATYISDLPALVITEIMYHPDGTAPAEFIELYNAGSHALDLSNVSFTRGVTFHFAGSAVTTLNPGEYVLVVQNLAAFASRYSTNGLRIAGSYNGQLSDKEEGIELSHAYFGALQSFDYTDDWYRLTDGGGFSLTIRDPALHRTLWSEKAGWRPSSVYGGSPGTADPNVVPPPGAIVINEALTHSDASPDGDWIELHNTSTGVVHIGGWYLSDNPDMPYRYRIPDNTWLPAGGFVVYNASNHFAASGTTNDFGLSEYGESIVLSSGLDASNRPTGYRTTQDFGAMERERTIGRYVRSDGGADFVAQRADTRNDVNAGPLIGPLVVSEVLYRPPSNGVEFIEFYNCSASPVALWDPEDPQRSWRLDDAVTYVFPTGAVIAPFSTFVVAATNPAVFRTRYGLATDFPVFGPVTGLLDNAGDRIQLAKPLEAELTNFPFMVAEEVHYDNDIPWPVLPADGWSIERVRLAGYGNDAYNWRPGAFGGAPGPLVCADSDGDGLPDTWEALHGMDFAAPADADTDVDADRRTAMGEFIEGTLPRTPDEGFRIGVGWTNGGPAALFHARRAEGTGYEVYDRHYGLERLFDIRAGDWTPVAGCSNVIGGNQTVLLRESGVDTNAPVLYRGRVWLERR